MGYLLGGTGLLGLVLAGLLWYYKRRANVAEAAESVAEQSASAAEDESTARAKSEDARNSALVDRWKTGMDSAKENEDAKKALDRWRAVTDSLRPKNGDGH